MTLIEQTKSCPDRQPQYLPVAILDAAQLREAGWTNMSPDELRRAVGAGRLYSLISKQDANGEVFPAWQFVGSVQESLLEVLSHFADEPGGEIHVFWTQAMDELNELAPAEMIAGIRYEVQQGIEASQQRLLRQPLAMRLAKVINQAQTYNRHD